MVLIQPADITNSIVAGLVANGWGFDIRQVDYAPVGFGSHHWWLRGANGHRWFATIDDLHMGDRSKDTLVAALAAATVLRQSGHDFVVAPLAQPGGDLTVWVPPHYVLAVYPHVDGEAATYGHYESHERRSEVIDRLAAIHRSTDLVHDVAPVDDLHIPKRSHLEDTLDTIDEPWSSGPFAAEAQALLAGNAAALRKALAHYDRLVAVVSRTRYRWTITHGEPHRGNTIVNNQGVQLIDWESARIAPPERDLWLLIDEDNRSRADYAAASGRVIDDTALDLYRRWWDLCEVSLYTDDLRSDHVDTPESRIAYNGLVEHLRRATTPKL